MSVRHTNLKYLSIERLESIRDESYRSSCGQIEYCKETIDDELNRKYTQRDEQQLNEQLAQLEQYDAYLQGETMQTTENIKTVEQTDKTATLAPIYTNEDNAIVLEIDNSNLASRNARNKYTHRKHWIEYSKRHGYRHCSASYDSNRRTWCKPKKGTYNAFLGMFLTGSKDENLCTFGFYSPNYAEESQNKMDGYSLTEEQRKEVNALLSYGKKINDAIGKHYEDIATKQKEEAKDLSAYKFNSLYGESEIAKCTQDIELIVFRVEGKGIKKRCRNPERIFENIGYIIASPDQTREESATRFIDDVLLNSQATGKLDNYREINSAYITAKKCKLNARKGDSPFYGMQEMIFEKPIASKALEL